MTDPQRLRDLAETLDACECRNCRLRRKTCNEPQRPKSFAWWPVSIGWHHCGGSCRFVDWHSWPEDGSDQYPDATAHRLGWTLHIGHLQIYFGRHK